MMLESHENFRRVLVFLMLMAASLVILLLLPPISQDQNYHDFADQRTILGIPYFWNVVSNLPFIAVGAAGIRRFHRDPATFLLFLGILMTGFGSSYYHLVPNDRTLFWDRLPMSISFMAILALAVGERLDAKAGAVLLWPLIAVGMFSVLLWHWTATCGFTDGCSFFPALRCHCCFFFVRPNTPAHPIGSSLRYYMPSQRSSNSPTMRFILLARFLADIR
jgi:hypothetical protein